MKKVRYLLMRNFLILFIIIINQKLYSQDTLQLIKKYKTEEIHINYIAKNNTPITFLNLNNSYLNLKSLGQEPSFILSETPSITNFSDAGSSNGYSYFRIRGIDQTRINVSIDGVPLNEPEDQGAYFSNFPDLLNSIGEIQIQRGIGTSKNGIANYGGSIQLSTNNIVDSMKTVFGLNYGSFNSHRIFGEINTGIFDNKSLYIRVSNISSNGYKYNSSNKSNSIFISGTSFTENSLWKINFIGGQQQNNLAWLGVSDSLIKIDSRTNANQPSEKDNFNQYLTQLQNSLQIDENSSLHTSIYYSYLVGNYDFDLNNYLGLQSNSELYKYTFNSNLIGLFSNYKYQSNLFQIITGIHINTYNREHIGSEKSIGQLYDNTGYKNEFSIFTKLDYQILENLNLYTDLQFRNVNFDYKGDVKLNKLGWNFVNPLIGINYNINDFSSFYYSFGKTGREPTRNDIFNGNDNLLSDSLGNPLINSTNPEYVFDQELGYRYFNHKIKININLFYMDFENEILLNGKLGPNGLTLTSNVDNSVRSGAELNVSYELNDNIILVNNSSYIYSRIFEQNEKFSPILTPPIIINQEIIYKLNELIITLTGRYQHSSFIDFSNNNIIESYFLLNTSLTYQLNEFSFSFLLNNLTNTKYFNQGYVDFNNINKYFIQAPFNFNTSIQYSF